MPHSHACHAHRENCEQDGQLHHRNHAADQPDATDIYIGDQRDYSDGNYEMFPASESGKIKSKIVGE